MQSAVSPSFLDHALGYATEFGWAVFSCHSVSDDGFCTCGKANCKSKGKHPRTQNGSLDATKDKADITVMFAGAVRSHNIGIATGSVSNLVVVDVDQDKGADINDLIFDGIDQTIFNTAKVKTGAGLHFYYRLPNGVTIKNSASRLGKFIDIRGDGGYVIAPPSKHVSGRNYEWLNANADGGLADILEFPSQWIKKLEQPLPSSSASPSANANPLVIPVVQPGVILPDSIDQGKRNVELTKIAGALRSKGLSEGAIFAALHVENQRICQPPLDDKELHQIAKSVSRYPPQTVLTSISEDAGDGPPDTIKAQYYGAFREETFPKKEVLALHIGKGDIAMLSGATNAGKSTLLRNIVMAMASGRPFEPFFNGLRPIKTIYFDLETDGDDLQRDALIMEKTFTIDEMDHLKDNLMVVPRGTLNGSLLQFNTQEQWVRDTILKGNFEFVVVDNVSAAFDLRDENSGSEVTQKVMKPLTLLAHKGHCGIAFAHHFGKAKILDPDDVGVHAGRGTSSFGNLSRTVFNMYGDVSKGETTTVYCAKRKTDGGQSYKEVLRLEADRWFHHTTIVASPAPKSCMDAIVEVLERQKWSKVPVSEILKDLAPKFHRATVFRNLKEAQRIRMIETRDGRYWLAGVDDEDDD